MLNSVIRKRWLGVIVLAAAIIAFGTDESPVALNAGHNQSTDPTGMGYASSEESESKTEGGRWRSGTKTAQHETHR